MNKKYPLISIVVSNYNGASLNILQDCLTSFKKIDYPNYELILVDNASTDESINIAKKIIGENSRFKIVKNSLNMYSQGLNLGFEEAKGEYVAYFNNDIEVEKQYFHKLVEAFEKNSKLALAQGKLLWYFDHSIIDSAGESMDIFGNPVTIGYKSIDEKQFEVIEEILSASGSACMMRRNIVKETGVYAPYFGIGYEDMDLGLRLRQKGYALMRIPQAVCYHKRGATDLSEMVRVKVRWHFNKNRLATMIRNYPLSLLIKTIPITILIYTGSFVWESLSSRNNKLALTRLQSIYWVFKNLIKLLQERNKIRRHITSKDDKKILKLFATTDLPGKIRAVIMDKIQFSLPWTYPAEIRNLIPKNSTVLDIGCGDGYLANWINHKGEYHMIGVDINKKDLEVAKRRITKASVPIYEDVILADLEKKRPLNKKFDVVLCSQVVEHLKKDKAMELIEKIEKLAKKRVIIATINGFFQFNSRIAGEHDVHLSGWSPREFILRGYKVQGSGLGLIYKPGALKDSLPKFLHPLLFSISYMATPLLRFFHPPALFLIAYKDI